MSYLWNRYFSIPFCVLLMTTPSKLDNVDHIESTLQGSNTSNDDLLTAQIRGCRLKKYASFSAEEINLLITQFFGLYEDAENCLSNYNKNRALKLAGKLSEDEKSSFCNGCENEYKNLSSYFNLNIVKKAKTKDDICPDILEKMNSMTELYKPHRCDYGVELGLTPLYISLLFISFCILVYGNCAIKLFQGTKDAGMNIVCHNEIFQTKICSPRLAGDLRPANEKQDDKYDCNDASIITKDDTARCDIQSTESFTNECNNSVKKDDVIVNNDDLESRSKKVEKHVEPSSVVVVDVQYLRSQEL